MAAPRAPRPTFTTARSARSATRAWESRPRCSRRQASGSSTRARSKTRPGSSKHSRAKANQARSSPDEPEEQADQERLGQTCREVVERVAQRHCRPRLLALGNAEHEVALVRLVRGELGEQGPDPRGQPAECLPVQGRRARNLRQRTADVEEPLVLLLKSL